MEATKLWHVRDIPRKCWTSSIGDGGREPVAAASTACASAVENQAALARVNSSPREVQVLQLVVKGAESLEIFIDYCVSELLLT